MHKRLVGERVAQDRGLLPLRDQIALRKVAEGDRVLAVRGVRHRLRLDHLVAHQRVRLTGDQAGLPQERAVGRLHRADARQGGRVHHERRALAVRRPQRGHQPHQAVGRRGRVEAAGRARLHHLQFPEGARLVGLVRHGRVQEAARAVGPAAVDEGVALGGGELVRDLGRQPALHVEGRVVQHGLGGGRVGVELAHRRGDLGEGRRARFRPGVLLAHPAGLHPADRHQLAIAGRADRHDLRDRADGGDGFERPVDGRVDLSRDGIAAGLALADGQALGLDATDFAAPEVAFDEQRLGL